MTAMLIPLAGAPSAPPLNWNRIDWKKVVCEVRRLQMRIAKAFREGRHGKVKALQWILTHSFSAKLLAVKRVTQNKGAKTPGVDNVVWKTSAQKMQAVASLKRRGYQTQPLKRIYIPKKQRGKLRPLSIPVIACRAQQALHLLSLEPISESIADKNAYGFRPLRSTADAIGQCFIALAKNMSPQWVLEGDIKSCFDSISNAWLLENVHMDKEILGKWLTAGYVEKGKLHSTIQGTPQGGVISPTLLVVTLSGLEQAVKSACGLKDKINVIAYADDFIITGITKEVLENKVKPAVESFLWERGLSLSQEKTKITHIEKGFDFLGMNIRKYNGKLIIKPAKSSLKRFLVEIRKSIKLNQTAKTETLINHLNLKIRGWSNYYRHVCSSRAFRYAGHAIFEALWRWAVRRHPEKGARWVHRKYFRTVGSYRWMFSTPVKSKDGQKTYLDLVQIGKIPIRRHVKIRASAIPFDPHYHEYFDKRISLRSKTKSKPSWWLSWWKLLKPEKKMEKSGSSRDGLIKA